MGPLNYIFAALMDPITANLADSSIVPTFGTTGADRLIEAAPRRIIFVPTYEEIQPARGQGGDFTFDTRGMSLPDGIGTPLFTRACTVECDIWGFDRDTAEVMYEAVVSSVHDEISMGGYRIQGAQWLLPEELTKNGECIRVNFQFFIPLKRLSRTTTTVVITNETITPQLNPLLGS